MRQRGFDAVIFFGHPQNGINQRLIIHRLVQEKTQTQIVDQLADIIIIATGNGNHRHGNAALFQLRCKLQTTHLGHVDIQKNAGIADVAHLGQKRLSGEPYISHPVAAAEILADLHLDADTVIGAILHDVIEDTPIAKEDIEAKFGKDVAEIVDGVTKLDQIKFKSREEAQAESFRKMLLAMVRDGAEFGGLAHAFDLVRGKVGLALGEELLQARSAPCAGAG